MDRIHKKMSPDRRCLISQRGASLGVYDGLLSPKDERSFRIRSSKILKDATHTKGFLCTSYSQLKFNQRVIPLTDHSLYVPKSRSVDQTFSMGASIIIDSVRTKVALEDSGGVSRHQAAMVKVGGRELQQRL